MQDEQWKDKLAELCLSPNLKKRKEGLDLLNRNRPSQLCRYCGADEFAIQHLMYECPWISNPKKYEDKTDADWFTLGLSETDIRNTPENREIINLYKEQMSNWRESIMTCSFSASPYNTKLWEEHADGSRGICIVYETRADNPYMTNSYERLKKFIYPMLYTDKKPDITNCILENTTPQLTEKFDEILMVFCSVLKNSKYAWEDEWRYVEIGVGDGSFGPFIKPSKVYLGAKIDKDLDFKSEVLEWARISGADLIQVPLEGDPNFVETSPDHKPSDSERSTPYLGR